MLVLLAENARIPVDNPATHLELTMIHEAMLLEYSARHLALMEWAAALEAVQLRLHRVRVVRALGLPRPGDAEPSLACSAPSPILAAQARSSAGVGLALIETVFAKLRVFRAPEFLATAFLLGVLGLLVHLLLESVSP